jgi:3-oxoacyl-[acyl-carrier protein] reductase
MDGRTAPRVGMHPEDFRAAAARGEPGAAGGLPEDIAALGAFLCSDEASYLTGQTGVRRRRGDPSPERALPENLAG